MTREGRKEGDSSKPKLKSSKSPINIIHLDDDKNIQSFVKFFLENDPNLKVTSVNKAEEALALSETNSHDCLVTDYDMPDIDGITFAKSVRERSDIPIIMYTGRGSEEVAERAFAIGINDYIRKEMTPAHYQLLSQRVKDLVEAYRTDGENKLYQKRLETLHLYSAKLSKATSLGEVSVIAKDAMRRGLGINEGLLLFVENDLLITYTGNNSPGEPEIYASIVENELVQKAVTTAETIIQSNVEKPWDTEIDANPLSQVYVPVKVEKNVVAVLSLRSEATKPYGKSDKDVLEILAEHVGSTIKRIKFQEERIRYERTLEALFGHALKLNEVDSIDEVAESTLNCIEQVFGFTRCSFALIEGDQLIHKHIKGVDPGVVFIMPLSGNGVTVKAATTGQVQLVSDCRSNRDFICVGHPDVEALSELAIPVKIDGKVRAVIDIENSKINAFTEGDRRLVEMLSEHVATAMSRISHLEVIKAHENTLKLSETRLKQILDSAPEGVVVNSNGRMVYLNQHFVEMMGYTKEELFQKSVFDITSEDHRRKVEDYTRKRARGEDVPTTYEVELIRKDGSILPVEYSISRILFNGEIASLTFIKDSTQRMEKYELEKRIGALHKHAHTLNELLSIEDIAKTTLNILHAHLNCNLLSIRLSDGEKLNLVARWGVEPIGEPLPIQGTGLMAKAAREKSTIIVNNTRDSPDYFRGNNDALSEMVVPIIFKEELIGVINAEGLKHNAFGENEKDLTEALADEVGSAIIRIRSLERILLYSRRLESLSNHALKLAECETIAEIASTTINTIYQITEAQLGSFALVREGYLEFIYETGVAASQRQVLSLDGPGITVRAVKSGEIQLVSDTQNDADYLGSTLPDVAFSSELAIPVKTDGEVKAVINLESRKANAFTEADKKLFTIFSEHVSSALTRIHHLEKITASEEKYRKAIDSSFDSILIGSGTKIVYLNKQMAKLLGYDDPSELLGSEITHSLPEDEREQIKQRTLSRQRGEPQPERYELKLLRKDGSIVEVEAAVSMTEFNGSPAVISFARDITEKKRYETKLIQLHESGKRLASASILDTIFDISIDTLTQILGFDFAGIGIVEGSKLKYVRSTGAELPKDWSIDLSKPSISARAIETCTSQLVKDTRLDPDYLSAPGFESRLSELAIPIVIGGRSLILINIEADKPSQFSESDISLIQILVGQVSAAFERVTRYEEEIQRRETHQREIIEGVERVNSMVRHDLRGPLQTIQSSSYLLQRRPERVGELTKKIDDSVNYIVKILDDLKMMAKKEKMNIAPVSLDSLIETSLNNVNIPAGIKVERDLQSVTADVDQYSIRRVVDNLIKNAVDEMKNRGTLTLTLRNMGWMAHITVADTGRGITEEVAEHLFTPFYTTKSTGTGLGLAICKEIAESHGGNISFESKVGQGTRFTVRLPISKVAPIIEDPITRS